MMKKHLLVLTALIALLVPTLALASDPKPDVTAAEKKMAEAITAEQISNYLYFIASDAMGGRDTPSQGLDITAEFLAMNLRSWGFKPAGDNGSFFQKMNLRGKSIDPSEIKATVDGMPIEYSKDFYVLSGAGKASGDLVFAGNGWMVKSKGIDPYKGIDVKGNIVVITSQGFNGRRTRPPEGVTKEDLSGEPGDAWADPITHAKNSGASAVIMIATDQLQTAWKQIGNFVARGGMSVDGLNGFPKDGSDKPAGENEMPLLLLSAPEGKKMLAGTPGIASKTSFDIKKDATIDANIGSNKATTQNVVAIWEGSDPKLKNEMVAIGAHYDHVGTREGMKGDNIFNGADDDGSGTVAVLSIAEALAKAKVRPKRSILFVWHAGEEKGLWGSEFFNKFPTVDIKNVIAQLNIDMIGRSLKPGDEVVKCDLASRKPCNEELSGPNEIYVIGADMMSSTLGKVTRETNDEYLKMKYNYRYDDPKDPNRFFFRSDHFNYAVNGIPVVFWFDGVHLDYHQPGDEPEKIDYEKMEKVTRTIFMTLWQLSALKDRPMVDKKLPPELTNR